MKKLILLLPLAVAGCVGYPMPYLTRVKGRAALGDDGKPVRVEAAIIKECQTVRGGETQDVIRRRGETTDKDGRYSFAIWGLTWNFKNFVTLSECTSRVQRFLCRPECKMADAIDIDVLGR